MRKYPPFVTGILIMSVSGFLLIAVASYARPPISPPTSGFVLSEEPSDRLPLSDPLAPQLSDENFDLADNSGKHLSGRIMERLNRFASRLSFGLAELDSQKEEHYVPSVFDYNLMALSSREEDFSPEDDTYSDQEKLVHLLKRNMKPFYDLFRITSGNSISDSYGGQMYEYLNRKDAEWASSLYKWLHASPEQAAQMQGKSAGTVLGSYDPTNPAHNPADPQSWTIPSWKNVSFRFYDGDGKAISLRSNSQDILSMASVYTYYGDWKDTEIFLGYIDELWQLSHSYSTQIGPVYYCEGCVDPNAAAAQETAAGAVAETVFSQEASSESTENAQNVLNETQSDISSSAPAKGQEMATEAPSQASFGETAVQGQETQGSEVQTAASAEVLAASPSELEGPASEPAAASLQNETEAVQEETQASERKAPEVPLNAEGKFCPGHVDLTITARITGITERKNLYTLDRRGAVKTDTWNGWSEYNKAYVSQLYSKDWSLQYNLSPIELALGTPLTFGEINHYLSLLPPDISTERRAVISYALNSVGKIPYYYGGKARSTGYEANNFASLTSPDRKGRVLSGLDCSGWLNWVYWSSLGQQPSHIGTSGLVHAGRAIGRSELKPGDIIVRLGSNSHVVMFLAWDTDGSMICIHETGGAVSNVTVSKLNLNWPYYRALLD